MLLLGESGTGKELAARAIHWTARVAPGPSWPSTAPRSPTRCSSPSCSGTRRARSPAPQRKRRGLFAEAAGGTLFLDEVGDMSLAIQAKLLRVLQDKVIRPVGANQEIRLDVRVDQRHPS